MVSTVKQHRGGKDEICPRQKEGGIPAAPLKEEGSWMRSWGCGVLGGQGGKLDCLCPGHLWVVWDGSLTGVERVGRGSPEAGRGTQCLPWVVCDGLVEKGWSWKSDSMSSDNRFKAHDKLPDASDSVSVTWMGGEQ